MDKKPFTEKELAILHRMARGIVVCSGNVKDILRTPSALKVHIYNIRAKLQDTDLYILNSFDAGYVLKSTRDEGVVEFREKLEELERARRAVRKG